MHRVVAALSGALILAGCSGGGSSGGSGGGGTVVVPTPSPSASTSPTPTPGPSYSTFAALTGDQNFPSACTALNATVISGPATPFGNGLTFRYTAATQIWGVIGDGLMLSFGPGDVDPASPAGLTFYAKTNAGGIVERLRPQIPGAGGTPTVYTRVVGVSGVTPTGLRVYNCVIGVPTLVSDVPAATVVTYSKVGIGATLYRSALGGGATAPFSSSKSTVSILVNLTNGTVTTVLHLIGSPLPLGSGPDLDLGTATGVADIDPATGGYYGTRWSSPDMNVTFAQFGGRFFGPQGVETGYALTFVAERPDSRLTLSGSVFGIR